jgi:hypothetical protein
MTEVDIKVSTAQDRGVHQISTARRLSRTAACIVQISAACDSKQRVVESEASRIISGGGILECPDSFRTSSIVNEYPTHSLPGIDFRALRSSRNA